MKLYVTWTSPYARVARVAVIEHRLDDRVEIIEARTRETASPYYDINPSGRVPYLVVNDGQAFEESALICAYFDDVGHGGPIAWAHSHTAWQYGRLEALARSFVDGIAVWSRELRRPRNEQSPTIIAHEQARAERLAKVWAQEVNDPVMQGDLNFAQLLLFSAIDSARRTVDVDFVETHQDFGDWHKRLGARQSLIATQPPS